MKKNIDFEKIISFLAQEEEGLFHLSQIVDVDNKKLYLARSTECNILIKKLRANF